MSTHVQEIKEKLDIVNVLSSYIKLDKSGANYKARCPFHNEKTPSFFVSPERNTFYCFGCQAKGDIFSFVEKFEGLDFMGALKVLAERAGVKLDKSNVGKDNRKELLFEIMEKATVFYEEALKADAKAMEYTLGRGLSAKTIEDFRIGFAPGEWRALRNFLKSKGYRDEDVSAVGLIKRTDKPGGPGSDPFYDTFRGRVMFPIGDTSGRIIAFTGRTLDEAVNPPKYLNSPETVLFSKSKALYGLDKAKADIRKRDYSILVEGQMDLVMSHQAGFTNTVAASGTAFTEDDGRDSAFGLLTRLSDNIVLAFDSDSAGQKAVRRIVPAISLGMNVKIVDIKGGKDPADIIKASPKDWAKTLETKKDFVEYLADTLVDSKATPANIAKQVKMDIFPFIRAINDDTPRFQAIKKIANKLSISEDALWKDLQEYVRLQKIQGTQGVQRIPEGIAKKARLDRFESIERKVLGLLYSKKYFGGEPAKKEELKKLVGEEKFKVFESLSEDDVGELTLEAEITYGDIDTAKEWQILILSLEEEYAKTRLSEAMAELHRVEKGERKEGEKEDRGQELMKEINNLSKRIQEVKRTAEKMQSLI